MTNNSKYLLTAKGTKLSVRTNDGGFSVIADVVNKRACEQLLAYAEAGEKAEAVVDRLVGRLYRIDEGKTKKPKTETVDPILITSPMVAGKRKPTTVLLPKDLEYLYYQIDASALYAALLYANYRLESKATYIQEFKIIHRREDVKVTVKNTTSGIWVYACYAFSGLRLEDVTHALSFAASNMLEDVMNDGIFKEER